VSARSALKGWQVPTITERKPALGATHGLAADLQLAPPSSSTARTSSHAAHAAFGSTYPEYDVVTLGRTICATRGWTAVAVRFYTAIPGSADDARWYWFWTAKLAAMGRQGVHVFSRPLRYRSQTVRIPDGTEHSDAGRAGAGGAGHSG